MTDAASEPAADAPAKRVRRARRTLGELAADYQAKADAARAKEAKRVRDLDARRKILLGASLLADAANGGRVASVVIEGIRQRLGRPHDRAAFGLEPAPSPAPVRSALDDLAAGIRHASDVRAAALSEWRDMVVAWEQVAGRSWFKDATPEARARNGFGPIGELAAPKGAQTAS